MILHWTQSLLQFLLWYAVASIGGCASYWALRLAPDRVREVVGNLAAWLIIIGCVFSPLILIPMALLGAVQSCVAAFCEKAIDKNGGTWSLHFGVSLLTYLLSFALDLAAIFLINLNTYSVVSLASALDDDASCCGGIAGLLLTPAAISLFRWIVHNSHTRPGVDRHLREEEGATR